MAAALRRHPELAGLHAMRAAAYWAASGPGFLLAAARSQTRDSRAPVHPACPALAGAAPAAACRAVLPARRRRKRAAVS